jgi:hypothetical protein
VWPVSGTVWKNIGITVSQNDLIALIDNMRGLSKQWRSSIGKRRELVFYIDAC